MSQTKFFVILLLSVQATFAQAQTKGNCTEIGVKVEVVSSPSSGNSKSILKIEFTEKGDFKVKLLDSKGNVTELEQLEVNNLARGEYDVIITDTKRNSDRCPYYKRVKIEGQ
jgi:hypothetical protein